MSNAIYVHDHELKDPYVLFRDATCPGVIGYELFRYFYNNREKKIPICNPWKKNLAKLIFLEVFVDVYFIKALIKYYNLDTK